MTDPDSQLQGIEYIRFQAESTLQDNLPVYIQTNVGTKLRQIGEAGYYTADEILGQAAVLTRAQMLDDFLTDDTIPTARVVFDTTTRRIPLLTAMAKIAVTDFSPAGGRRFRDDGRNPWKILESGFRHRTINQDPATVIAALRNVAATMGISTWAHVYHQTNGGNGVPTISTAEQNAGSGASNAGWQYAITLPDLPHSYAVQDLTATILGGPNIAGGENDNTRLLLDAPLLGNATNIAISGGPMNEFTFLTAVRPDWIVGFRRLSVQGDLAWRSVFEQEWRAVAAAPAIKALLESANEFTFPE
jgi:hypothetical protein